MEQRAITLQIQKMKLWWSYDEALHFLALHLTIVWRCIEFQLLLFKLCSGQKWWQRATTVISPNRVMVLVYCTSSPCPQPLYIEFQPLIFKICSRQQKVTMGKTFKWVKKELWFLCTALPFNILDHWIKLYWIPTSSFQVMLWTRKSNKGQ
jgi:hypothetical protein